MNNNIESKIVSLTKKLLKYNYQYYNLNQSDISDLDYDKLLNELKVLEQQYPQYKQVNTPTQNVGGFVSKEFVQAKHSSRLYSLQDVFDFDQILKFDQNIKKIIEKVKYSVELKIDGVAIVLTYKNGYLVRALTRGDGVTGEDVTSNVKTIRSIPHVIDNLNDIEIRGEIYMSHDSFITYNQDIFEKKQKALKELETLVKQLQTSGLNLHINLDEENEDIWNVWILEVEQFIKENKQLSENLKVVRQIKSILKEKILANPRNAASGSIRNLDASITKKRRLDFLPYGTNDNTYQLFSNVTNNSHSKTIDIFTNDFKFNKPTKRVFDTIAQVIDFIEEIGLKRSELGYDIDGIVIKVDDNSKHNQIGTTEKFPKWAVAYKYPPLPMNTRLIDVKYQVGKSGVITPVAILEPVVVSGSLIRKVTLHNRQYIKEKQLQLNDIVSVHKSGDVIPQIIGTKHTSESTNIDFIKKCPICEQDLIYEDIRVVCVNDLCKSKMSQKIAYFANRNNMNIESLSIKNAELLVEYGLVNDVLDLYNLTIKQLMLLPRFGEKSAQKLIDQIQKSKGANLSNLISSLAITSVGTKNSKYLSYVFQSFENFVSNFEQNNQFLNYLDDISQKTIEQIQNFLKLNPQIFEQIEKLQINTHEQLKNNFYEDNKNLLKIVNWLGQEQKEISLKQILNEINFVDYKFSKKLLKTYNKLVSSKLSNLTLEEKQMLNEKLTNDKQIQKSFFEDKTLVITGTLQNYKRKELQTLLESKGAKVSSSVSSLTSYVIYGLNAGSKLTKAQQLNVSVLSENELITILQKEEL